MKFFKQCLVAVLFACAAPAMAQTANLTFVSEPGDYVGQGESLSFSDGIDAYGSTDGRIVSVSVNSDGHWFSLNLAAPDGQALAPGRTRTPRAIRSRPATSLGWISMAMAVAATRWRAGSMSKRSRSAASVTWNG